LKAIKFSDTLYMACQMLGEDIHFVSQDAMPGFMAILAKAYIHVRCGVYDRAKVKEELEQITDLPSGFKQSIVHEWHKFDESDQQFLVTMRQGTGDSSLLRYASGTSIESVSQSTSSYGPLARLRARRQVAKVLNAINQSNQDPGCFAVPGDMKHQYKRHPSAELDMADGQYTAQSSMSQDIHVSMVSEISTGLSVSDDDPLFAVSTKEEPVTKEHQQLPSQLELMRSDNMKPKSLSGETDHTHSSNTQVLQQMGSLRDEMREMRAEIQDMRALILHLGSDLEAKAQTTVEGSLAQLIPVERFGLK